jgi:hypothetical protein
MSMNSPSNGLMPKGKTPRERGPLIGARERESLALARRAADLRRSGLALIKQANELHAQSQAILRRAAERKKHRR